MSTTAVSPITLKGSVTKFQWTNPHCWIELSVPGEKGAEDWSVEMGAPLGYARAYNGGGLIEVYLEARLLREGATLDGKKLTDNATALPIDVRDVLPLRP